MPNKSVKLIGQLFLSDGKGLFVLIPLPGSWMPQVLGAADSNIAFYGGALGPPCIFTVFS